MNRQAVLLFTLASDQNRSDKQDSDSEELCPRYTPEQRKSGNREPKHTLAIWFSESRLNGSWFVPQADHRLSRNTIPRAAWSLHMKPREGNLPITPSGDAALDGATVGPGNRNVPGQRLPG